MKSTGLSLKHAFLGLSLSALLIAGASSILLPSKELNGDRRVRLILRQLCARQKAHFSEKKHYSLSLQELGWSAGGSGDSLQFERFPFRFQIDVNDESGEFRILAVEKGERDEDGKLEIWEIGPDCVPQQKSVD